MIPFLNRLLSEYNNVSKATTLPALMFLLGISGLVLIFLLPNPIRFLAPQVPLLTKQDWPGSRTSMELFFVSSDQLWEVIRQFRRSIYIENNQENTRIDQVATWYAVPAETLLDWDSPNPQIPSGFLVSRSNEEGKPVSRMFCAELVESYQPRTCNYDTYWEHWMVQVSFWSQDVEDLPLSEIQMLTTGIDQRLMSVPEEPCFWFLCTGGR